MNRDWCNGFRYDGGARGHYESYFQRANHPTRPLAFWIRYTAFVPKGRAGDAVGELWAIWFDGEAKKVCAVKQVVPWASCRFDPRSLSAALGDATLDAARLTGSASSNGRAIAWTLGYESPSAPLLLLPEALYSGPFPKAKALVGSPLAVFRGELRVDDEAHAIESWVGSQNHNWGSRHTDEYAWGQVAGFDDAPESFLEVTTARVKLGPVRSPWMTLLVLRHGGEEFALNAVGTALRAEGRYEFFAWSFASQQGDVSIEGRIEAPHELFVGLPYDNPPGGRKTCLNTKLARCTLTLRRPGRDPVVLITKHRAAFEILTDRDDHRVPVLGV
ncbi:MAG: hypothetical protein EPO40_37825 [Myxococcaceae bacterium]|nr:MAG: hypothetical protein EPO40_37825 [Myxococcaceae bacterium]